MKHTVDYPVSQPLCVIVFLLGFNCLDAKRQQQNTQIDEARQSITAGDVLTLKTIYESCNTNNDNKIKSHLFNCTQTHFQ